MKNRANIIKERYGRIIVNEMLRYYEENNLYVDKDYLVFKARYKLSKVFDKHIFEPTSDLNINDLLNDLRSIKGSIKRLHNHSKSREGNTDPRSGKESYGYDNDESIRSNLLYISDRWYCQFRLRWLLDLL